MKFGYFDDANKEYVITSPKTPLPWINYLGSENFFSLISNADIIKLASTSFNPILSLGFAISSFGIYLCCSSDEQLKWVLQLMDISSSSRLGFSSEHTTFSFLMPCFFSSRLMTFARGHILVWQILAMQNTLASSWLPEHFSFGSAWTHIWENVLVLTTAFIVTFFLCIFMARILPSNPYQVNRFIMLMWHISTNISLHQFVICPNTLQYFNSQLLIQILIKSSINQRVFY